ncbi:MAG TPA: NAD(P)(+) transhydrogenase (Re/Si-specific) subunit beta [Myxococcaceae bacterium]|nr:NAD(P)(+) transhydrogenase (Re/Si-specific) subunit beta [Myxococcaceae bacterium]
MTTQVFTQFLYLIASLLFIVGLRGLTSPVTARRGVFLAEVGMLLAVIGTLLRNEVVTYEWIILGIVLGGAIGTAISLTIPMTKMPERIAFSHAFGGLAVMLVGISERWHRQHAGLDFDGLTITAIGFEVLLGALTFTGSMMAFGKLQGILPSPPITFRGQNAMNFTLLGLAVILLGVVIAQPNADVAFYALCALGLLAGISLVLPIGGADMPVVICLLNSYAGLAASATGFALHNNVLIICGALDGGSGFILALIMSKAMNRSFANVLFGAFGSVTANPQLSAGAEGRIPNQGSVEDAVEILRAAQSVIVVPGYGMAVSQAQHAVRDLANALKTNGTEVRYAIHPVAGRMPGHMNVLLAEADVPYDDLYDLDRINDQFTATDVALVVGANDVVNPAARSNPGSPIYGMPVLAADQAKTAIVLKRSLAPGFAGIENELFVMPKTMMVLGDAKKTLQELTAGLKQAA